MTVIGDVTLGLGLVVVFVVIFWAGGGDDWWKGWRPPR